MAINLRNPFLNVKLYRQVFSLLISSKPNAPERSERSKLLSNFNTFFSKFSSEERKESKDVNLLNIATNLTNMIYALYEIGIAYGLPLDQMMQELHNSNMSKLGSDGKVIRRSDGKIINGPNYKEPDFQQFLN